MRFKQGQQCRTLHSFVVVASSRRIHRHRRLEATATKPEQRTKIRRAQQPSQRLPGGVVHSGIGLALQQAAEFFVEVVTFASVTQYRLDCCHSNSRLVVDQ
ncbi:MAG: hypothetical protein H8E66_31740 [Planctomycetes bacterium]|nr:hypothetical protein [Planctomycetota bacterium]